MKFTKNILYKTVIISYGFIIFSTIINLLDCFITSEFKLYFSSQFLSLVPYIKFSVSHSVLELLPLIIILGWSIYIYIGSIKEYLNEKLEKYFFVPLNLIWLETSSVFSTVANNHSLGRDVREEVANSFYIPNFLFLTVYSVFLMVVVMIKVFDVLKYIRFEETSGFYSSGRLQFHMVNYNQINKVAKLSVYIEISVFIFALCMKYSSVGSDATAKILIAPVYIGFSLLAVFIFFYALYDYYRLKNKFDQKPPSKNFLKKLNIIQIVSFVLYNLMFALLMFY